MIKRACIALICLFAMQAAAAAHLYMWTDKNGVTHYSNVAFPPDCRDCETLNESEESNDPPPGFRSAADVDGLIFTVNQVFDGDSFLAQGHGLIISVRLAGIDAPERGKRNRTGQPFAEKSKAFLEKLISRQAIVLKAYGKDRYNRQLAEVFCKDRNVNLEMIRHGLAEVYRGKHPEGLDSDVYYRIQRQARQHKRGMWVQRGDYQSPKIWRRSHSNTD